MADKIARANRLADNAKRRQAEKDWLATRLAADYAPVLPKAVADRVFARAWEYGHASGEGEVENYYIDIADIAVDAYQTGVQHGIQRGRADA